MSKRCRHLEWTEHLSWVPIEPGLLPKSLPMSRFRCDDCGAWLSLGHSSETDPRVALEIRAAELAAAWDGAWNGFESLGMSSPGAEHAPLIEADIASGRKSAADLFAYYSGHLAGEIATHPEPK